MFFCFPFCTLISFGHRQIYRCVQLQFSFDTDCQLFVLSTLFTINGVFFTITITNFKIKITSFLFSSSNVGTYFGQMLLEQNQKQRGQVRPEVTGQLLCKVVTQYGYPHQHQIQTMKRYTGLTQVDKRSNIVTMMAATEKSLGVFFMQRFYPLLCLRYVFLLLQNTDSIHQVEDYVKGCSTASVA